MCFDYENRRTGEGYGGLDVREKTGDGGKTTGERDRKEGRGDEGAGGIEKKGMRTEEGGDGGQRG